MPFAKQLQLVTVADYLEAESISPVKREYTGGYVYAKAAKRPVTARRIIPPCS